jgi:outer membrane protein assembly factor BamB
MYAVTLDGGALRWRYPVQGASSAAVTADRLYFVSSKKGIHSLDLEGRLLWRQHLSSGTPQAPMVKGRALFVTLSVGGLFVVDRLSGRLIQRFNPGGGISSAPLLTRDSLYLLGNQGQLFALTLR